MPGNVGAEASGALIIRALTQAGLFAGPPPELPTVFAIATDSRRVTPGTLFLAVPGTQVDGHEFVEDAVSRGAVAVVVGRPVTDRVPQVLVRDPLLACRHIARAWYDDPGSRLEIAAVTGTNGKTTTTAILRHLLNAQGQAGSIGTLGAVDGGGRPVPSTAGSLTTPGPVDLYATLADLSKRGVRHVVMEASSHSLHQGRLDGLVLSGAIFTNLTREHLDYHGTMEEYLTAKLRLLELMSPGGVVAVNADDPSWEAIPRNRRSVTYGKTAGSDVTAAGEVMDADGCRFLLTGRFGRAEITLPLPGGFNVSNALAAAACALAMGVDLDTVATRLTSVPQVPGRMERLATKPCTILRDYAHTPDALERVLRALRPLTHGRLVVLFGCGGARDRGKRAIMGEIASEFADLAVLASDNPRTEDPEQILDDIASGFNGKHHLRFVDRHDAIVSAIELVEKGDTLLLAGKGHETYQIIGTIKHPFDERAIVAELTGS